MVSKKKAEAKVESVKQSISIEKGVEMPDRSVGRATKYPWDQMEVGDSFFVQCDDESKPSRVSIAGLCQAMQRSKRFGEKRKFSCRKVAGGMRVWRTE